MTRPGTDVTLIENTSSVGVGGDSGTWFAAGLTDRGPANTAVLVLGLSQFIDMFGTRQSYSILYDCVEAFFREGGSRCYVSRVVGPGASTGTHNLLDGSSATSLVAHGIGPGAWSANFKVAVYASGSGYGIQVQDSVGNVLEDSGPLADQASGVEWSQISNYIRLTIGGATDNPVAAAAAVLSTGSDDRASITDTEWTLAIAGFTGDLGIGQISAPGQTSANRHTELISNAAANNRVALLDLIDSSVQGTLTGNLPASSVSTRFAAAFAPWYVIPGDAGMASRTIPPSPIVAGLIATNDPVYGVNVPSAGNKGISSYAIGLTQASWSDAVRSALNAAGVNVIRNVLGSVKVYGWRSLADPTVDSNWLDFSNARLFNQMSGEFDAIGENYIFDEIDGINGATISNFHDDLASACLDHYQRGDLFGDTSDQAFLVDTGPAVNTATSIGNQELHAAIQLRMSPFAEYILIEVAKRATSDVIS